MNENFAITPEDASKADVTPIPREVFEAFNELIIANLRRGTAIEDPTLNVLERLHPHAVLIANVDDAMADYRHAVEAATAAFIRDQPCDARLAEADKLRIKALDRLSEIAGGSAP